MSLSAGAAVATKRVPRSRPRPPAVAQYTPTLVLTVIVVAVLLRAGVGVPDLVRYSLYWSVAVVLPGLVVSRSLLLTRATILEDLAIGAVTGISLEILAWVVGVTTGVGSIVRFWWVPVLAAGAALPRLRRRVLIRTAERVPLGHSVTLCALACYIVATVDATSRVFRAPLPPNGADTYFDMWWQLSVVQEMAKYEPPQIPQLAGVPFRYHYFANVQIASGVRLSGVSPEVVTFRLWYIPVILISIGMAVALGRMLTESLTAGVVTAGVVYGLTVTAYIWPAELAKLAESPLTVTSPSQLLANIGLSACAFGAVLLLRGRPSRSAVVWVGLIVLGACGDKSTVVPLLIAGTVIATGRAGFTRSWVAARWSAIGAVVLLALEIVIAGVAAGTAGGKVTILGPLQFLPVFNDFVPANVLRATNHGLLLDSITSPRAAGYALLATVVVLGLHTVRLAGVAGLFRRTAREQYAHWWLAGAVLAGYAAMLSIDHVSVSQVFFGLAAGVLGAALTVSVLWDALGRLSAARRAVVGWGLLIGCVVTLLISYVIGQFEADDGINTRARIFIPLTVVVAVVSAGYVVWLRSRRRWTRDGAWVLVFAAIIGAAIPATASAAVTTAIRWFNPGASGLPAYVTSAEQRAMLWLRSHSAADDVVATNAYCTLVVTTKNCEARGFWISGLSGRRVVLEGWAYTDEALKRQGVGGLPYVRQPAPFPERFKLNRAVFDDSDRTALAALRKKYDVRWLVSVHRAGPTPSFPADVARTRFDNGAVTIFEVR